MKYEEAIKELEEIVEKLENGNLPLSQSKEIFERGLELCKFCHKELNGISGKIYEIKEELDKLTEEEI
ncbi:MAG: exodeoxyribonuclease VII small subunit [Clostridia bacterium]|nr:exodeoxyribonuclease VII small subunit [Clostridia bacterium]